MRSALARLWYWAVTLILFWVCYLAIDRMDLKHSKIAVVCIGILIADRIVLAFMRPRKDAPRLSVNQWKNE